MEIKYPEITTKKTMQLGLVLLGIFIIMVLLRPKSAKAEEATETKKELFNFTIDPTLPLAERLKLLEQRLGISW